MIYHNRAGYVSPWLFSRMGLYAMRLPSVLYAVVDLRCVNLLHLSEFPFPSKYCSFSFP
jgi:hypothetical protein